MKYSVGTDSPAAVRVSRVAMAASSMSKVQRRSARANGTLRTALAAASLVSTALPLLNGTFALPYGGVGRPGARDKLRPTYEVPREAPVELDLEHPELPEKRVPYAISLYAPDPSDGHHGLSAQSREYVLSKVKAALHSTENWIKSVDVRVTIDHHMHKTPKKQVVSDTPAGAEGGMDYPYEGMKAGKRELAPFLIECTVHLDGKSVVLSANTKHAQATLPEAVDHMYEFLRHQMTKEKARRIDQARRRKAQAAQASDVLYSYSKGQDDVDDEMMALEEEELARMNAEAEQFYSLTGN